MISKEQAERMKNERLGQRRQNRKGFWGTVIAYDDASHITVKYDDIDKIWKGPWGPFDKGTFGSPRENKEERLGRSVKNTRGFSATCIEYNEAHDIVVQFDGTDETWNTYWDHFIRGDWKHPLDTTKFGGVSGRRQKNGAEKYKGYMKEYKTWRAMITRCYSPQEAQKHPNYAVAEVCSDWMNFETFYAWITQQENYEIWKNTPGYNLDKDIISKHNTVYSADYCLLIPNGVNKLFTRRERCRGRYPIGVSERSNGYAATLTDSWSGGDKRKMLGIYNTPEEAFLVYKNYKEALIKRVADQEFEKGTITKRCRDAMYAYQVEITD